MIAVAEYIRHSFEVSQTSERQRIIRGAEIKKMERKSEKSEKGEHKKTSLLSKTNEDSPLVNIAIDDDDGDEEKGEGGREHVLVHISRCNSDGLLYGLFQTNDGIQRGGTQKHTLARSTPFEKPPKHHKKAQNPTKTTLKMAFLQKTGRRLAKEIQSILSRHPTISKLSLVGASLGGLYTRYSLKHLSNLSNPPQYINYITLATPHLGVDDWISDNSFLNLLTKCTNKCYLTTPTVSQLTRLDKGQLVKNMASKEDFIGPLKGFRNCVCFSNVR